MWMICLALMLLLVLLVGYGVSQQHKLRTDLNDLSDRFGGVETTAIRAQHMSENNDTDFGILWHRVFGQDPDEVEDVAPENLFEEDGECDDDHDAEIPVDDTVGTSGAWVPAEPESPEEAELRLTKRYGCDGASENIPGMQVSPTEHDGDAA